MRQRNMWIGETGRKLPEVISEVAPDADHSPVEQSLPESAEVNPTIGAPLAVSELSLDELVPRTWKRW